MQTNLADAAREPMPTLDDQARIALMMRARDDDAGRSDDAARTGDWVAVCIRRQLI